jgi:hypothetical protein
MVSLVKQSIVVDLAHSCLLCEQPRKSVSAIQTPIRKIVQWPIHVCSAIKVAPSSAWTGRALADDHGDAD